MLKKFLKEDNYHFFERFITCLKDSGLIKYNLNDPNFDEFFMKDFIITDAVKCRAATKLLKDDIISVCTNKYLFDEIEEYGHNKLIFIFSRRSWSAIYDHFKPEKSDKSDEISDLKIASIHGMLFYCKALNSYFIPLSHFSQTIFNHFLRNSYFDYLNEGLTEYLSKKS